MAWPVELLISGVGAALWIIIYIGSLGNSKKATNDSKEFLESIKPKKED